MPPTALLHAAGDATSAMAWATPSGPRPRPARRVRRWRGGGPPDRRTGPGCPAHYPGTEFGLIVSLSPRTLTIPPQGIRITHPIAHPANTPCEIATDSGGPPGELPHCGTPCHPPPADRRQPRAPQGPSARTPTPQAQVREVRGGRGRGRIRPLHLDTPPPFTLSCAPVCGIGTGRQTSPYRGYTRATPRMNHVVLRTRSADARVLKMFPTAPTPTRAVRSWRVSPELGQGAW